MRLLSQRVREMTDGRGFSVLFSDVGPVFYAKNGGWNVCDATELVIPSISTTFSDTSPVESLSLKQAEDCINDDVKILKEEFLGDPEFTIIQMIPQHTELEWATLRDKQAAQYLLHEEPNVVGVKVSSPKGWGYVLWFHEHKESSLTVLRLREPPTDDGLRGLLGAAISEAKKSAFQKVTIWSPSERLENVAGIKKVVRKSALPGLLYFGEEEKVHWRTIEKLGWC